MIKDVTDLEVYRLSLNLIPRVYDLVRKLPKSESDIRGQIKRCAKSVSPNIAEGFAKRSSDKEFKRFLKIAIASSDETISHLRTIAIVCPRLFDEAKTHLVEWAALYEKSAPVGWIAWAYIYLGSIYIDLREYDDAVNCYTKIVAIMENVRFMPSIITFNWSMSRENDVFF